MAVTPGFEQVPPPKNKTIKDITKIRQRMTEDFEAERAGRKASDTDINDDFARRLEEARAQTRRGVPLDRPSPAANRAATRANTPVTKERFVHETDIGNVESIRRTGIRPSRGGSAMGHEGVYAYQGGAEGRHVPEGRALIEFEADPNRISGRGRSGASAVALSGGQVDPGDITGGWNTAGRMFNFGSGLKSLYDFASMLAPNVLPQIQTPADWIIQEMLRTGESSPWNPKYNRTVLA